MSAIQISDLAQEKVDGNTIITMRSEWLLPNGQSDLATIPPVAPGSFAYTGDMTLMYQYDGTAWKKIGGDSNG